MDNHTRFMVVLIAATIAAIGLGNLMTILAGRP